MKISRIIETIEKTARPDTAASWDHSGVQVAACRDEVHSIAVCLDPTPESVGRAATLGADFVLAHHPLLMQPRYLDRVDAHHDVVRTLLTRDMWLYGAHTSLDANPNGPAGWLADALSLTRRCVLEQTLRTERVTHCLTGATEQATAIAAIPEVLAIRESGGALFVSCDACAWKRLEAALRATLREPCSILPAAPELDAVIWGFGIAGDLPEQLTWDEFTTLLGDHAPLQRAAFCGNAPETVRRVAYCTGSGSSVAARAFAEQADIFITGDVKYHAALDTTGPIIDVGHFCLEEEMMRRFALRLQEELPEVRVTFLPAADPLRSLTSVRPATTATRG